MKACKIGFNKAVAAVASELDMPYNEAYERVADLQNAMSLKGVPDAGTVKAMGPVFAGSRLLHVLKKDYISRVIQESINHGNSVTTFLSQTGVPNYYIQDVFNEPVFSKQSLKDIESIKDILVYQASVSEEQKTTNGYTLETSLVGHTKKYATTNINTDVKKYVVSEDSKEIKRMIENRTPVRGHDANYFIVESIKSEFGGTGILKENDRWLKAVVKEIEQSAIVKGKQFFVIPEFALPGAKNIKKILSYVFGYVGDVHIASKEKNNKQNIYKGYRVDTSSNLKQVYYQKYDNPIKERDQVQEILSEYANKEGYIRPDKVDTVRSLLADIPFAKLRNKDGKYYIDHPHAQNPAHVDTLKTVLDSLQERFGIEWEFDYSMSAKGRFDNGKVYINPAYATDDTPIHEYMHPFLLALKKENPSLYKRLVRAVKRNTEFYNKIKSKYGDVYSSEEDIIDEAIVTMGANMALVDAPARTLWRKFVDWITNLLNNLFFGNARHVAKKQDYFAFQDFIRAFNTSKNDLSSYDFGSQTMFSLNESKKRYYREVLNNANDAQKEVIKRLSKMESEVALDPDEGSYVLYNGTKLNRVTSWIDSFDYYKYEGESRFGDLALKIGSEVDAIAEALILGDPLPTTEYLPQEAVQKVVDTFNELKEEYPDHIIIPQVTVYDVENELAGTADFILVDPEGNVKVKDLKTSRYNFQRRRRAYKGKTKADVFDKHDAQLTAYKAMLEKQGFTPAEKDALSIIPIKIIFDENDPEKVVDVEPQEEIKHSGTKDIYVRIVGEKSEEKFTGEKVLANLRYVLQKKRQEALKANNYLQAEAIADILEDLKLSIPTEAVAAFIDEAYKTFLGTKNWDGYYSRILQYIEAGNAGEMELKDVTFQLDRVLDLVDLYLPALEELFSVIVEARGQNPFDEVPEDSELGKMRTLIVTLQSMKKKIKDEGAHFVAKQLAKSLEPQVVENLKKEIKLKEKQITTLEKAVKAGNASKGKLRKLDKLKKSLDELKTKFYNEKGEFDIEHAIYTEVRYGGYRDISFLDRWLNSPLNSKTTFLSAFALTIKKAFEKARLAVIDLQPKVSKLYRDYAKKKGVSIDRPEQVNERILEKSKIYRYNRETQEIEEKEVLSFVAPIDYSSWRYSLAKVKKEMAGEKNHLKRKALFSKWVKGNMQERPEKHIEGVTKIGDTILIETVADMERRKLEEFGGNVVLFKRWKEKEKKKEMGAYKIPNLKKFANAKFAQMDADDKAYYAGLMDVYLKAQRKVPGRFESDRFIAPYVSKSITDRGLEDGIFEAAKYSAKSSVLLLEEDYQDENIERAKVIPVMYWNNRYSMDYNEVSKDVAQSVLRFAIEAERYKAKEENIGTINLLQELIEETNPLQEDTEGNTLLDKAAVALGLKDKVKKYVKKHGENHAAALLEAFIDKTIYEVTRQDPHVSIMGKRIDVGKATNALMKFASLTQIAFKPLTAVANSLTAQLQIAEEAFARQYFTPKEYKEAFAEYTKHEGDFMRDFVSPYNKSFLGQLHEIFDPLQGEFNDAFGRKVSKSALKAHFGTSIGFIGMHKGEHRAAMVTLIALLKKKKMEDGRSYYDHLKEKFEKEGELNPEEVYDAHIANQTHSINKQLHGIYDRFNSPDLLRYAIGRLILMYRKFFYSGLKRRFGKEYFDLESGETLVGFTRLFYSKLFTDFKGLLDAVMGRAEDLTPAELAAVRRAIAEHVIVMVTGLLAYALIQAGWGDPDDDDGLPEKVQAMILYEVIRVNSEISLYFTPGDINNNFLPAPKEFFKTLGTVSAIASMIIKLEKVFELGTTDLMHIIKGEDIERYKRAYGVYEKGDSKFQAALAKLFGVRYHMMHPETALDALFTTRGIDIKRTTSE